MFQKRNKNINWEHFYNKSGIINLRLSVLKYEKTKDFQSS